MLFVILNLQCSVVDSMWYQCNFEWCFKFHRRQYDILLCLCYISV